MIKNNTISIFFRKKQPQFNSIEEVFDSILQIIEKKVSISKIEVPKNEARLKSIIKNIQFSRKNKGDINHITGHINYITPFLGRNTILTIHDVESVIYGSYIHKLILKIFWLWIPAWTAKSITVISEFSKNQIIQTIPFIKGKITVIYNPVRKDLKYNPKIFNKQKPLILHIGTKENKNLKNTIEAIKEINCKLLIIGKLTEAQIYNLKLNKIDYINKYFIPYRDIIKAYKDCDLVSFVSTYEGFGMPIIEAQAIGRPVLTSNICSMPEIAGDGAVLVDPYNLNEIRIGILQIIENDSYRDSLIQKGLINIQRFQSETIAKQYLDIYNELNSSL